MSELLQTQESISLRSELKINNSQRPRNLDSSIGRVATSSIRYSNGSALRDPDTGKVYTKAKFRELAFKAMEKPTVNGKDRTDYVDILTRVLMLNAFVLDDVSSKKVRLAYCKFDGKNHISKDARGNKKVKVSFIDFTTGNVDNHAFEATTLSNIRKGAHIELFGSLGWSRRLSRFAIEGAHTELEWKECTGAAHMQSYVIKDYDKFKEIGDVFEIHLNISDTIIKWVHDNRRTYDDGSVEDTINVLKSKIPYNDWRVVYNGIGADTDMLYAYITKESQNTELFKIANTVLKFKRIESK